MTKLPVLLSIPHGGTQRPPELDSHLSITDKDLFDDSDPFVIEIYDLGTKVERVIKTNIARAFVDLNRSLQDLPPQNPDGLIKSSTCYEKPIYKTIIKITKPPSTKSMNSSNRKAIEPPAR